MERLKKQLEDTGTHIYELYETQSELKKLQMIEKTAEVVSSSAAAFSIILIFFFVLVFASITAAYAVTEWTGHAYIGFLSITGFYLLLGILLLSFKDKWIKRPLMNNMIKKIFDHE
jgi:hypothetical protein